MIDLEDRLWSKIDWQHPTETGCWLWTGCLVRGYGQIQEGVSAGFLGDFRRGSRERWYVTQLVWIWAGLGPLPKEVCHTCDNPSCCNWSHFFGGNRQINKFDEVSKLRHAYGSRNGEAILNEAVVVNLRFSAHSIGLPVGNDRKGRFSYVQAARELGVDRTTVRDAVLGTTWRHAQ